jgi:hypothetical protein
MNSGGEQQGRDYRSIVHTLRAETCWELDRELGDPEDQLAAVTEGEAVCGELYFSRPETTARITFVFPAIETGGAAKLLLDNPLDPQIQYSDTGFVGELGCAHERIASSHEAAYVDPVVDPSVLARMYVPTDYDEDLLIASLRSLDDIAVKSERLHEELRMTLSQYSEDGSTAGGGDGWSPTDPPDEPAVGPPADSGWVYVAPMKIEHATDTVRLPDELFETGILQRGGTVIWAYEKLNGVLIVSNQPLEDDEYLNVGTRNVHDDGRCTIPTEFFPPDDEARSHEAVESVPENAYVRQGQRYHFVYKVGMDEGETRSCYLLTGEELDGVLS